MYECLNSDVNNSTQINNTNNHFSLSPTEHSKEHDIVYHIKKPNPVLGQAQNSDGIQPVNGIPRIP
jgi:hypothetical protein